MSRFSIPPVISLSISSSVCKFSTLRAPATSSAEKFYSHMQKSGGNIENAFATVQANVNSSCVNEVLRKCSTDQSILGLRFFIWAGLQSTYRHSSYMYSKACEIFRIKQNPHVVVDVVESYRIDGYSITVKTIKVVLNLCKEAKLANEALWVLRKAPEFNLRADSNMYNTVIGLFCQNGNMVTAEKLMREMRVAGLYPDMITFVEMIKGFCNVGRLEDAFGLVKVMRGCGCVPNVVVYSALLNGVCHSGNMVRTMELLTEMEKEGGDCSPNVVTYTSVIQGFCSHGLTMEALSILDRMIACGCMPNRVTVATLLDGLCKEGLVEEAYKLIDKVVSGGSLTYGDCYGSMVVSLIRFKLLDEAENVFRRLLNCGVKPNGLACSLIIKELCIVGRVLDGCRFFDEIEKMGCLSLMDSDVYSILLEMVCIQKCVSEAAKIMRVMLDNGVHLRSPHADNIFEHLKRCGDSELISLWSKMKKRL